MPQKEEPKSGSWKYRLEQRGAEADFEQGAGVDARVSGAELDTESIENAVVDSGGALTEGGEIAAQKIKKNKKKKRKKLIQFALIKNSVKNTKKIRKKYSQNSARVVFRVRGESDQEACQTYDKKEISGEIITKIHDNIRNSKDTKNDNSPDRLKKSGKNLQKIKKNDLTKKNFDKNISLQNSIAMNNNERCETVDEAKCGEVEAKDDAFPQNKKSTHPGFGYAEVAARKSKREREATLLELNKALAQAARREKELAEEQGERREKTKNIMRQRKSVEYEIASLQKKADKWQKISQEAYFEAVCCWSLEFAGNSKTFLGIPLSKMYYGASLAALRYCAEYQKDLAIEREKLSQKDRELMRLLERS